ncbi:MAG: peptidoglycan D,D-transpeptidase FtsI family protein [Betaproteobacteria bacterium]|jgi:cell division protein FtsI (penicillin-binding protein 3)|nr:penicillin-binding protein 2 [Rhodocyclaceae bacterium]MCA3133827.1 penicillin-binding protein 2 [Rhodocyclaceae bacterium]MCA3142833.1 penicillin-binding protein 2 [Rhodocyclaceae bacterium]MCA3145549.1 penicillin-binding protein 2 [Rhodocyclaceae bacterium]MCE2897768.1 penicillin-binding protein 2 [Betaproteobacteria bacterium]
MNPATHPQLSLRLPQWRTRLVFVLLAAGFTALSARAFWLQGMNREFLQAKGEARYARLIEISAHRGMITDRHGDPLAISTPMESVWASPGDVNLTRAQRASLARLLELEEQELDQRLANRDRDFVYLKRHLPPAEAAKVVQLDLPGVFLQREYRRYYPAGDTLAHVLGFTDLDDKGQEGVELAWEDWLVGRPGSRRVIKDRIGRVVQDVAGIRTPQQGRELALSIDLKLQYLAWRELKAAVAQHQAKAGSIVVLDVRSGEVLALANLPSFNPNNRARLTPAKMRNRAVVDLFEPGSTLKPFTVAAALEQGTVRPDSIIETAGGSLTIGSATIRDAHPAGNLTVSQVIQKSSNVGTARMALAMPPERLWQTLNASGFGAVPRTGFPGEAGGRLRDPSRWRPIEQATMSYGHGISVSLLQLARAYTVFCGDGELVPVSLVRRDQPAPGQPVISPVTAATVRAMLELVTQPGGTAPRAQVPGYRVAGKTGTAHKLVNGRYAPDRYASSFIGFAPASRPRLLVAVLIDEPSGSQYYGGQVAAPVFAAVMAGALRMLSVPPDQPVLRTGPVDDLADVAEEV